ncbi:MAG: PD40 domain-containing protein [Actinobacteria bacterium]|nr:PD40 domain-containing protein [Actinomycetota bacterium]
MRTLISTTANETDPAWSPDRVRSRELDLGDKPLEGTHQSSERCAVTTSYDERRRTGSLTFAAPGCRPLASRSGSRRRACSRRPSRR